jgi:pimeloyl-ACP methyl ester carboxylesterase
MPALQREADFFAFDQGALGPSSPDAKVRMFYAFQPADSDPECKPLLLFFQGGPFAGMVTLWGGNTGRQTLDPLRTGSASIADNPFSWTRFANVLYVDSPYAGFSYILDAPYAFDQIDPNIEAALFIRALIAFVERHPSLERAPVTFVGESYGGLRAMLLLRELLHYDALRTTSFYRDDALADAIERYLRSALAMPNGALTPAQIGGHFSQILIQPYMTAKQDAPPPFTDAQTQALIEDSHSRIDTMMRRLLDPALFRALTGVPIEGISGMFASGRNNQLVWEGHSALSSADDSAFVTIFGALPPPAHYYTEIIWPEGSQLAQDMAPFKDALRYVRTFITNSPSDIVANSEALANAILSQLGVQGTREALSPRIDQLSLRFEDGTERKVRFPRYDQSGHPVSLYQPELLADDVRDWLASRD